jgi:hypothetical protein
MPSFEAQVGSTTYYFVAILVILHFAALVSLLTYFIRILHEGRYGPSTSCYLQIVFDLKKIL